MAQSIKNSPYKHEDLTSILRTHLKKEKSNKKLCRLRMLFSIKNTYQTSTRG